MVERMVDQLTHPRVVKWVEMMVGLMGALKVVKWVELKAGSKVDWKDGMTVD